MFRVEGSGILGTNVKYFRVEGSGIRLGGWGLPRACCPSWTAPPASAQSIPPSHFSISRLSFQRAIDSGLAGEVPRGEKMLYSGTDPES